MSDWREKLRLYLVSPDGWGSRPEDEARLRTLIRAGVRCVQYREKTTPEAREVRARRMAAICREEGAIFLINDDPSLAVAVDADGVHVGETDASVREARALLGGGKIVGATARTIERAVASKAEGADYLGVGAIYDARASKADAVTGGLGLLERMRAETELHDFPIVAIGGITTSNAHACFAAGADGVAMIRGLWRLDHPQEELARFR